MRWQRWFIWTLIGMFLFPVIGMDARASSTITFNTTALFDAGTKASVSTSSDMCEHDSQPNSIQLNNSGKFIGVGETVGSYNCATGAWGVNPSGLVLAYDMQTLNAGKMKDLSGNGNDGTITGTSDSPGDFGRSRNMNGTNFRVKSTTNIPSTGTFAFWFLLQTNAVTAGRIFDLGTLLYQNNVGNHLAIQFSSTAFLTPVISANIWHSAIVTWTSLNTSTTNLYLDKIAYAPQAPFISFPANPIAFGESGDGFGFYGFVDEGLVLNRIMTASERTAFATDGRSSFLSSGSWTSPVQSSAVPVQAEISFTNQTSNNRVSRFQVISGSGSIVYDTLVPYFSSSPVSFPINTTFDPTTWMVKLFMIGNGSATSQVTSLLLSVGPPPTLDAIALTLIIFVIAILILSVFGFAAHPGFFIADGIVVLVFAFWTYAQISNLIVAAMLIFVGAVLIPYGAMKRPIKTSPGDLMSR